MYGQRQTGGPPIADWRRHTSVNCGTSGGCSRLTAGQLLFFNLLNYFFFTHFFLHRQLFFLTFCFLQHFAREKINSMLAWKHTEKAKNTNTTLTQKTILWSCYWTGACGKKRKLDNKYKIYNLLWNHYIHTNETRNSSLLKKQCYLSIILFYVHR